MKRFLSYILFFSLLSFCFQIMGMDASQCRGVMAYNTSESNSTFSFEVNKSSHSCTSFSMDSPCQDFCNDAQNRTRRVSFQSSFQRQIQAYCMFFSVDLVRRNATLYKESLTHIFSQAFKTVPCLDEGASEHYVYGMRHILI